MASGNKKQRCVFTTGDEELLLELVQENSSVLNNTKTNGIQPQMRKQVDNKIL